MAINISSFFGAGAQFFDNNGIPLTGGLMYVYSAGTTTPATTYTTSSGAVSNTNPIVLDAAGRTPNEIWITGGVLYKYVLKTSTGVTIGTYDNIPSINDPTTTNNLISVTGTNTLVGTATPPITGYVAGTTFSFIPPNTNTGAVTINIDGFGGKDVYYDGSTPLAAGAIQANKILVIEYDGTRFQTINAKVAIGGTASTSTFLRGDNTWALPFVSGLTTLTLTSAAPSATLTSASNQYVLIASDATVAVSPSIVMPDMTTLMQGVGRLIFSNTTPYNVALKDAGGTVREFIAPGANYILDIKDITTANGQWNIAYPTIGMSNDLTYAFQFSGFQVNSTGTLMVAKIVRLTSTVFALVWSEFLTNTGYIYAQPFTINNSTKVITAGSRITVGTQALAADIYYALGGWALGYDSDNAGHALVGFTMWSPANVAGNPSVFGVFGLSYSGGALYASSLNSTSTSGVGTTVSFAYCDAVAYLGGSSAYAAIFAVDNGGGTLTNYYRGYTVTGTTTVTVTASASNTTASTVTGTLASEGSWASRTSLTTFTAGYKNNAGSILGRALAYSPAANTFTVATRTNQARLDCEQGVTENSCSFAAGGFMYCNGKAFVDSKSFDITNAGAAGVTAVLSTAVNVKPNYATAYASRTGANTGLTVQSSLPINGTSILAGGVQYVSCDPSTSAYNINYVNAIAGYSGFTLMSASLGLTWLLSTTSNSLQMIPADIGTPFTN